MADDPNKPAAADGGRYTLGLVAVGIGVLAILVALLIVITQFETAADVAAVLGAVVSPIAAIVAAYFGVQAGSAGKAAADQNAKDANDKAIALAANTDPATAAEVLRTFR